MTETVGTKTAWQLWAESVKAEHTRGEALRKRGWFTGKEFADKMGWSLARASSFLRQSGIKSELALDSGHGIKTMKVLFYEPPPR